MGIFDDAPLFQPTGTDWIDHAFTAALLDDLEEDRERSSEAFDFSSGQTAGEEDDEEGISDDLEEALSGADEALDNAEDLVRDAITDLELAKTDLDLEEPDDCCSQAWSTWNEKMEKLQAAIDDLEQAVTDFI